MSKTAVLSKTALRLGR